MHARRANTSDNTNGYSPAAASFTGLGLQCKLSIGAVNDPLEEEADAMAERVMRMPDTPLLQRKCAGCEEEDTKLQRKPQTAISEPGVSDNLVSSLGTGQPLDMATRDSFEPWFRADFSHVEVHSGAQAAESARSINAQAYTVGANVVFGSGQYRPNTLQGKQLLAHELTHVRQQRQGRLGFDGAINNSIGAVPHIQRKPGDPPEPTPAESLIPDEKIWQKLLNREYADKGDYEYDGNRFIFKHDKLQKMLEYQLGQNYWRPTAVTKEGGTAAVNKGDSAGKAIKEHPAWVNDFQEKLINQQQPIQNPKQIISKYQGKPWDKDSLVSERLVEAFLRAWTKKQINSDHVNSNLSEFYRHIGTSESNNQSTILGGPKGSPNWCGPASERAIVLGLMRKGLRFKSGKDPVKYTPKFHGVEKNQFGAVGMANALQMELQEQIGFFHHFWYHGLKPGGPKGYQRDTEKPQGQERQVSGSAAWSAPLYPGDYIYIVNGGVGPLSGHVATVIKEERDAAYEKGLQAEAEAAQNAVSASGGAAASLPKNAGKPKAGDVIGTIKWVSGNAKGEGVRTEEVKREIPPDNYNYMETALPANKYDVAKSQLSTAKSKWDKTTSQLYSQTKKLMDEASALGWSDIWIPFDQLGKGRLDGTRYATLPSYQSVKANVAKLLPEYDRMNQSHDEMDRLIDETKTPVHRTEDPKYDKAHVTPMKPGHSWVVSIVRTHLLDAHGVLAEATKFSFEEGYHWDRKELDKYGVEPLGNTIEALYPGALEYLDAPKNQ